jgi:hypothetical protein
MNKNIGIYYYPWYHEARWRQHPKRHTPRIGEYASVDFNLITHHARQMQYLKVDFVIIEVLPLTDWDFAKTFSAIEKTVSIFRQENIAYSFLLDCAVSRNETAEHLETLLSLLAEDEIKPTYAVDGKYPVYFFAPSARQAYYICNNFTVDWDKYFACYITGDLHTPVSEFNRYRRAYKKWRIPVAFLGRHGMPELSQETPLGEIFSRLGYVQFWGGEGRTVAMNGHIPVIPGYDDLLLQRNPQAAAMVPRRGGHTLVEQFRAAVASGADTILIYSWNEYFEDTQIEPTLEYGDFYLELTRRLIAQVKNDELVRFPEDMDRPKPAPVLYLTPELENLGRREADGVPRWDAWDYAAEIENIPEPLFEDGHAVFRGVSVKNAGTNSWPIASEGAPIRLGVRLADKDGKTLREGRAELGGSDIAPGATITVDIRLELDDQERLGVKAVFGVVWEGKFWMSGECAITLSGVCPK